MSKTSLAYKLSSAFVSLPLSEFVLRLGRVTHRAIDLFFALLSRGLIGPDDTTCNATLDSVCEPTVILSPSVGLCSSAGLSLCSATPLHAKAGRVCLNRHVDHYVWPNRIVRRQRRREARPDRSEVARRRGCSVPLRNFQRNR